jgi:hypothetical protein
MNVGSSVSSSRSSECFQEVGNKEGMVKTLAKPMLHYRLLNCRASGLLEQIVVPILHRCYRIWRRLAFPIVAEATSGFLWDRTLNKPYVADDFSPLDSRNT